MYTTQDYILFLLAIVLFFSGLALLGAIIAWREKREAKRQEYQLHRLNRREDWHRQHNTYMAQMRGVLESVEGRKGA